MSSECSQSKTDAFCYQLMLKKAMVVPQGLLIMLLCDDETSEMVDHVQGHIHLLQDLHDSLLLMKNNQADKLFASVSLTITVVLSCLINKATVQQSSYSVIRCLFL